MGGCFTSTCPAANSAHRRLPENLRTGSDIHQQQSEGLVGNLYGLSKGRRASGGGRTTRTTENIHSVPPSRFLAEGTPRRNGAPAIESLAFLDGRDRSRAELVVIGTPLTNRQCVCSKSKILVFGIIMKSRSDSKDSTFCHVRAPLRVEKSS